MLRINLSSRTRAKSSTAKGGWEVAGARLRA
jgi:hypothetical protein